MDQLNPDQQRKSPPVVARRDAEQDQPAAATGTTGSPGALVPLDIHALYADLRAIAAGYLRRETRAVTLQPTALVNEALLRLGNWKSDGAPFGLVGVGGASGRVGEASEDSGRIAPGRDTAATLAWRSPEDFFALASMVMRQVLVDAARSRRTLKRGGPGNLRERGGLGSARPNPPAGMAAGRSECADGDTDRGCPRAGGGDLADLMPGQTANAGTSRQRVFDAYELASPTHLDAERADEILLLHEALGSLESVDPRCAKLVQLRFYLGLTVSESAEAMGVSASTAEQDWRAAKAWLGRCLRLGNA